jgi:hypothetical protein
MTDPNVAGNPRLSYPRLDLLTPAGKCDRAAVMRDAWKTFRRMRQFPEWTWSKCLSFAWARAREMRRLYALEEPRGARKAGASGGYSSPPPKAPPASPLASQWEAFQ